MPRRSKGWQHRYVDPFALGKWDATMAHSKPMSVVDTLAAHQLHAMGFSEEEANAACHGQPSIVPHGVVSELRAFFAGATESDLPRTGSPPRAADEGVLNADSPSPAAAPEPVLPGAAEEPETPNEWVVLLPEGETIDAESDDGWEVVDRLSDAGGDFSSLSDVLLSSLPSSDIDHELISETSSELAADAARAAPAQPRSFVDALRSAPAPTAPAPPAPRRQELVGPTAAHRDRCTRTPQPRRQREQLPRWGEVGVFMAL